jgi:hypothetical protein
MVPILSERSSLSPGKRLLHQRSSSSHEDPLNSAFLDGAGATYAVCSPAHLTVASALVDAAASFSAVTEFDVLNLGGDRG